MELRQLTTFQLLAHTLNFTRTATALDYAQSNVTAQIKALEEELGVSLFDRATKKVTLTEAGQRLLVYADKILELEREAQLAIKTAGEPDGTIRIGAIETLCTYRLPKIIRQYRETYPQVRVVLQTGTQAEILQSLVERTMDVGFVLGESSQNSRLTMEVLSHEQILFLAGLEHPLTALFQLKTSNLEGETLLVTGEGCSYRQRIEQILAKAEVHLSNSLEFSSIEAIKQCVMLGLGVTALPAVVVEAEIKARKLTALDWQESKFELETQMVWDKKRWLSTALVAFLELARKLLVVI